MCFEPASSRKKQLSLSDFDENKRVIGETIIQSNFCAATFHEYQAAMSVKPSINRKDNIKFPE